MMVRVLQIAAGAFALTALYLVWSGAGGDYLFATVVMAICLAFLAYRFRINSTLAERRALNTRTERSDD